MIALNLAYKEKVYGMNLIGIYSKNRYEWFFSDFACLLFGVTTVPLYDTLGIENLSYCLKLTELTSLFVSGETAKTILKLKDHGNLRNLITFDPLDYETQAGLQALKFNIIPFD